MKQRIRNLTLFIFGFLAVLTLTAAVFLLRSPQPFYFHNEHESAKAFVEQFRQTHVTGTELNLSQMYGGSGQFQILHPLLAKKALLVQLPSTTCSPGETSDHFSLPASRCDAPISDFEVMAVAKRHEFERILRHEVSPTEDFILNPPFLGESGNSYAYQLVWQDIAPANDVRWVHDHLSLFKPAELREILGKFQIHDPSFSIMARLSGAEIKALVEGAPVVITANSLLIKNESHLGFSPLSYWVYDLNDFKNQLKSTDYDLTADSAESFCLEKIGNACWTYNSKAAMSYVNRYSVGILISIAIFLFALIAMSLKYIFDKNREQQRQRISLQVLSHEFRTPVSSMLLLIEELRRNFPRIEEGDQDLVTKISSETYRLQRIIEMSKTYLQSTEEKRFQPVTIPSINTWIEDFAQDFDPRIQCELLPKDRDFSADPFWLRFVLANLVQNAFAHGKEPVRIRLSHKNHLQIEVEDQGSCEFESLSTMTEAFVKSQKSSGMGLGLNITKSIIQEWGGSLKFRPSPTSFTFTFDQRQKGPQA